jgi:ABC-type sulfate/molybdate transport systems ATPase subunit
MTKGLHVENLCFNYPVSEFKGLQSLSFKLNKGGVLVIAGKSGSGKSTLARCLYGAETLQAGSVVWNQQPVLGPDYTLLPGKQGIKYMGQEHSLLPFHTVLENIREQLPALNEAYKAKRTNALLRLLELVNLQHETVQVLSSGQKQRVALARALAQEPELLILDEPFSHLDTLLQEKLSHFIFSRAKKLQQTIVFVAHQPEFALRYATEALVLDEGQLVEWGPIKRIYENPKIKRLAGIWGPYSILPSTSIKHFKTSKKHLFIRPHQIIPCVHANKAQLKIKVLESRFNGKCFENSGLLVSEHPVFFYSAQRIPLHAILNYCLNVSDGDEVFQSGF